MTLENENQVVISGVGGYFPKSANIDVFKQRLLNNESLLETRWQEGERGVTNVIGKLADIELFDTSFFGIHPEQSNFMDPMQRLVLESTFEALIDAGVNPAEIRGKRVGVYAGSAVGENDNLFYESIISGFGITGHSRAMMPNRVSYWLNLKGPSCAYDTNWLSGVEVIQAAYEAIKTGHCSSAIVATANLALNSELSWIYNDMGLISPDGATRSFDANANGYGRSDGIIVLYIQRACDAKRTYAQILGVNSHFSGNRDGPLQHIDANIMTTFLRDFYAKCKVNPKDVEFVECYGAGQSHIDEAELTAIDQVYCKDRSKPLLVGSVKPNTGHAEASSFLMSLVKVLIAMETGIIPANISYESPNPKIRSLIEGRIEVVNENRKWNSDLAAVNGIGLASSYGHILLKANSKVKKQQNDYLPRLIAVSTRTDKGIQDILTELKSESKVDPEYAGLIQSTFKEAIPGHLYRGYAVLDGSEEQSSEFEFYHGNKRQTWFVYSGMGSQWCKMANDLMALPTFSEAIYKCHKVLESKGIDLIKIVTGDDTKTFENILHSFVGIAAVQIGLTDVLHALGVVPDGIIGHSVGELGCAYADGCLSAEQMILCAYARGKASLEASLIKGMMAAIGKGYKEMKDQCPASIEVACHNGSDSCTISGPTEDMEVFVKELQDKGLFARLVNVSNIAYHSRYIKPAAPILLKYLQEVIPNPLPRTSKWICTSIPEEQWNSDLAKTSSAEYHTNNLLSPVLFEEGTKYIPKESVVIEIAPHGLLQAILRRSLQISCTNIPLTHKSSKNQLKFLLTAIGKLYLSGLNVNIPAIYPRMDYPVRRGIKSLAPLVCWEHGEKWRAGIEDKLQYTVNVRDLTISLKHEDYRDLIDNQLKRTIIIPTSTYLAILYKILTTSKIFKVTDLIFENLQFNNNLRVPKIGSISLHIMLHKGSGNFELASGSEFIGNGTITATDSKNIFTTVSQIEITNDCLELTGSDIYNEFSHRGHNYSGVYGAIKKLKLTKEGSFSTIQWNNNWEHFLEAMFQQCLFRKGERNQNTLAISTVQRIAISTSLLPTIPTDLEVTYNYATEMLSTKAIQISGIGVKPLPLENRPISYDSVELTPLTNLQYKNIESGINLCLHIVMENFENENAGSVMIMEIITENPVFQKSIKNVLEKYTTLSVNISSVKDTKTILLSQTEPVLIIINNNVTKDCIKLLTSYVLLMARTDTNLLTYPEITQVAQFSVNGISYSLMRKTSVAIPVIVPIKGDTLSYTDLLRENIPWVTQLKTVLATAKDKYNVYLTSSTVPCEGIINFIRNMRSLPNMHNIRFVFLLDKKAPEFTVHELTYQQVFKNSLTLVVVKDGYIGSYVPVPIEIKEDLSNMFQTISNVVENTRLDYLGINVRDETIMPNAHHTPELGNIDYSGVTSSGQKIMGLAYFNPEFSKLVLDPVLSWSVPKRWTLLDAATVPHAYSMAYYAVVIIGRTKAQETVLVHGGCSAFGLAAINIALNIGCTVFTTVASSRQKAFIKNKFPYLCDRNILNACDNSFEPKLMIATGGEGAHVLLNCLSGSLLSATLRCAAEFGKFIQIGKLDLEQNNEIGMRIFIKNVSLTSITIEDIFDAPIAVKQGLHRLVESGLKNLAVIRLPSKVVEHQNIELILNTLKQREHTGKIIIKLSDSLEMGRLKVDSTSQFICDPKSSYLLYGGTCEMWIDVLEWLIFRGARKLVISSESQPQQAHIKRRLMLLQSYFKANLICVSSTVQTRDDASKLLSKVYSLGPIGAVFVLPNKNSEFNTVQNLDLALKSTAPKALLVNFYTNAAGICQLRTDAGFPTHNIQWENTLEFSDVLCALDDMLRFKIKNIFIKDDLLRDDIYETAQSLYKKLSLLLPNSIDQLKEETAVASTNPDFMQLPSLCARVVRELPPVFIIPGMFGRKVVKELASKLLYPTYSANFPNTAVPLSKMATELAARMKMIYPSGPYNIIAISYGGILAIEIAKILEHDKARTQLLLVDAAPDSIQDILKHLGEGPNSEIGLLCRFLNLTSPDIVKTLSTLSGWELRLKYALHQYECSSDDKIYLKETLTVFKINLNEISAYQPSNNLVIGPVSLLRPSGGHIDDVCGLPKYCKQTAEMCLVDGNHLSIVTGQLTASFINGKVMC